MSKKATKNTPMKGVLKQTGDGKANQGAKNSVRLQKLPGGTGSAQSSGSMQQKALPQIRRMVDRFNDMLKGILEDLPAKAPTEVRIFLSSTFSDMRAERNWLAREAYPKLKAFCYDELDLDFQVLDMRWGVTDDATNEHITEKLCLDEIANCQRASLGPTFVCILGDRYGFCPTPTEIPVEEYEILRKEAEGMQHPERHLLEQWYKRDDNAVPSLHVLQPIRTHLKHFADFQDGQQLQRETDTEEWYRISGHLKDVICKSALAAESKGLISAERVHRFFMSVTECELNDGLLKAPNAKHHALCFVRSLTGLDNSTLKQDSATRYTDVRLSGEEYLIDEAAAKLRKDVEIIEVPKVLPKSQIFRYQLAWQSGGVDPKKYPEHEPYLRNFCTDFVGNVMKLITSARDLRDNQIPVSEYYSTFDEILHHLHFCRVKCDSFKGQTEALNAIRSHLLDPSQRQPLCVFAESGVGKTSVMAMVMDLVPQWLGEDTVRVVRFLGTSPESTNIYKVLYSVAGQIADCHGKIMEPVGYRSYQKLLVYFPRFLRNIARSTKNHIVILLDSLDQLSRSDGGHSLKWLPLDLPPNVHIVVSTLPRTEPTECLPRVGPSFVTVSGDTLPPMNGIMEKFEGLTPKRAFVEVKSLPQETGVEIIEAYLSKKQRSLTQPQKDTILAALEKVPNPLFLKLLLDKAITWKSYTSVSDIVLASSVRDAITRLFTDLEVKFGPLLIARALGYLTVGLNGLSEVELEDVLSCDDEVLNSIYHYHNPPVDGIVRIPPLLWARVKHNISEYVVERQSQGKTTMFWYHRQFIEAAQERYTSDTQKTILHKNLADMFLTTDGLKKDINLTKRKLTIPNADRQITAQPLAPKNRRKLMALPYHLNGAGDHESLKANALCNLKFMQTKVKASSVEDLLQDYVSALEGGGFQAHWGKGCQDTELELLKNCLLEVKPSLSKSQHLPVELLARLESSKELPNITVLLQDSQSCLEGGSTSAMIPVYPYLAGPASETTADDIPEVKQKTTADDIPEVKQKTTAEDIPEVKQKTTADDIPEVKQKTTADDIPEVKQKTTADDIPEVKQKTTTDDIPEVKQKTTTDDIPEVKQKTTADDIPEVKQKTTADDIPEVKQKTTADDIPEVKQKTTADDIPGVKQKTTADDIPEVKQKTTADDVPEKQKPQKPKESSSPKRTKSVFQGKYTYKIGDVKLQEDVLVPSTDPQFCLRRLTIHDGGDETFLFTAPSSEVLEDEVQCFAISDDDTKLAISLESGRILVWDIDSQEHLSAESISNVRSILFTPDGDAVIYLATAEGRDVLGSCRIGAERNGKAAVLIEGPINDKIIMARDGKFAVMLTISGITMVDVSDGSMCSYPVNFKLSMVSDAVITCVGDSIMLGPGDIAKVVSLGCGKAIKEVKIGSELLDLGEQTVAKLNRYEQAEKICLPGDDSLVAVGNGGVISIWDVASQVLIATHRFLGSSFTADDLRLVNQRKMLAILCKTKGELALFDIPSRQPVSHDVEGKVLAMTPGTKIGDLYVLSKVNNKLTVTLFDLEAKTTTKTTQIKDNPLYTDVEIKLSQSGKYLFFKMAATPKELEIINKTEKRNGLSISFGKHKFCALDLKSKALQVPLIVCYRKLTKVVMVGNTLEIQEGHCAIIGRSRIVVFFDPETGNDDQRLLKGTTKPLFYRPGYIDGFGVPVTSADKSIATLCMEKSEAGNIIAVGSEDGYLMVYDIIGMGLVHVGKTPNHGSPVQQVCTSPDGKWVAAVGENNTLKVFSIPEKVKDIFSIQFKVKVKQMTFSPDSQLLALTVEHGTNQSKVFLFKVIQGHNL